MEDEEIHHRDHRDHREKDGEKRERAEDPKICEDRATESEHSVFLNV
jgi:hypothetical protein